MGPNVAMVTELNQLVDIGLFCIFNLIPTL